MISMVAYVLCHSLSEYRVSAGDLYSRMIYTTNNPYLARARLLLSSISVFSSNALRF